MKLSTVSAVITGANQGLGLAISKAFLAEGADITICARDEKKLNEAVAELSNCNPHHKKIISCRADISKIADVEKLMHLANQSTGKISVLVCNAGIHGPKGSIETINWDEWSTAIDINLKGTVFSCKAAIPYLKKNKRSKIIILSGGGATKPMPNLSAYAVSKAAIVRFAETLAEELKTDHIDVNAVAPGALNTRLLDDVLTAGSDIVGHAFYQQLLKQKETGGSPLETGAELCVYLASSESDNITGKLISAVWDPWKDLQMHLSDLQKTDVYTLRRIVPTDRNLSWGDEK
ncbi:MAG: dehydrogenase [Gammaproteobacteria bacterium RIFCSPHIGHO2_02_FULL_39_13]|nr:MAG: dehydrogenase [Gammaproteobacteria bacterium RIFCSPHIGHO2_02_FULL_39_13]OGT48956.1 MAG: dehydrogenase [Gammaproteobacteria bacterium RIFCSPHIGHO2_12_FULL_39_24]